jgi:hypothetical protein
MKGLILPDTLDEGRDVQQETFGCCLSSPKAQVKIPLGKKGRFKVSSQYCTELRIRSAMCNNTNSKICHETTWSSQR